MSQLSEYVQQLLKQGYTKENIRQTLLTAGYTDQEIDEAFARHITTLPFVIVLGVLFLTIIAVFLFLGRETKPLLFSIDVLTPKVVQGDALVIVAHITNPNKNAIMNVQLKAPSGKITAQKTIAMNQEKSLPVSISIPQDAELGKYVITVKLTWKQQQKEQTANFDVEKPKSKETYEQKEKRAEVLQKNCPVSCDDQNFCTIDNCNRGDCVNTPILPCCGNGNCEEKEDCLIDCSTRTTSQDIKNNALDNPEQAITICATLAQQAYIDDCLIGVSEKYENKEACETVMNDELRDACYIPFAYKKDFTVCEKINNQALKNSCLTLQQIS